MVADASADRREGICPKHHLVGVIQATLAAVVVVYSLGLIKPVEFGSILRIRRTEFVWALAGLAGVTEVLGKYGRFIDGFSPGFGFTGIAVAVLGSNNPFGILLTSLLFGALEAGSMKMSYVANVSTNMVMVIQGLVILFVATPEIVSQFARRKGGKQNG